MHLLFMWRKIKLTFFVSFLVLAGMFLVDWRAARVSPAHVRSYHPDDLHRIEVCRSCVCAELDRTLWPEFIRQVYDLKSTWNVGGKGETGRDLYYVKLDWGKHGTFALRLWTRPSIEGEVIATFQKERRGGTSFYGDYSAKGLYDWLEKETQFRQISSEPRVHAGEQHSDTIHPDANNIYAKPEMPCLSR